VNRGRGRSRTKKGHLPVNNQGHGIEFEVHQFEVGVMDVLWFMSGRIVADWDL
jgi:hypothetical protein